MSARSLKILVIDDNEFDIELLVRALRQSEYEIEYKTIQCGKDLDLALSEGRWDIVLSEVYAADYGAREALADLRQHDAKIPLIVVSGATGEDIAVDMLKSGADDFIFKGNWDRLSGVINRAIRERETRAASEEARRAREQILAVVSHDLRNPLAAIKLNMQTMESLFKDSQSEDPKCLHARELLNRMKTSLNRVSTMVDNILDETKVEGGRLKIYPRVGSVNHLLSDISTIFNPSAKKSGIELDVQKLSDEVTAAFDYERLYQAISNLVANALKFTPKGGKVHVTCFPKETTLTFSVRDSGKGIPKKFLPLIFERFWQGTEQERQGVGLGLFIVKGIINAHGGKVEVISNEGLGSEFIVTLPIVSKLSTIESEKQTEAEPSKTDFKQYFHKPILLIEDDDDLRTVLKDCLETKGATVLEVPNLTAAEEVLRKNNEIELVLTDYQLPGSNGKSLAEFLHSRPQLKKSPVILVSAETKISERAKELNTPYWLKKPFSIEELDHKLKEVLLH